MYPAFETLFPGPFPLIGVVHLLPLPGSPLSSASMRQIIEHACTDARTLLDAGMDGLIVENFGDAPFYPDVVEPVTVAAMTRVAQALKDLIEELAGRERRAPVPLGINVLRNDAKAALSIAGVTGADFIRVNVHTGAMVTDQGLVQGKAHETLRLRRALGLNGVALFADVLVKHATPLGETDPASAAKDTFLRGGAQALIFSGSGTGEPTDLLKLEKVRQKVPEAPLLIGSGLTLENLPTTVSVASGAIVGTALKHGGQVDQPVSYVRAQALVSARDQFVQEKQLEEPSA